MRVRPITKAGARIVPECAGAFVTHGRFTLIVTLIGMSWMLASAWRASVKPVCGHTSHWPVGRLLAAATVLLLVFQFVLRPGIEFF
jgi:hypothetical protein